MSSKTWFRLSAGIFLTVAMLVVVAVAALFLFPGALVKDYLEAGLSQAVGRKVEIGSLNLDPGLRLEIRLGDVRIASAAWAESPNLARVDTATVVFDLRSLLSARLRFSEIAVSRPELFLQRDRQGRWSWNEDEIDRKQGQPPRAEPAPVPPVIERLSVTDGTLVIEDAVRELRMKGTIATVRGGPQSGEALELSLTGTMHDQPATLHFVGGTVASLLGEATGFPADVALVWGQSRFAATGTVANPLDPDRLDLKLDIRGPNLAETFFVTGIPMPDTPPYRIQGRLHRVGALWSLDAFTGTVGDSDLSGSLSLDRSAAKPFLKADVVSEKLDFDDLAGLIGAPPDPSETASKQQRQEARRREADESIFPKTEVAEQRLTAANMDVTFRGREVIAEAIPITELSARARLNDGRLLVKPLDLTVGGGRISGELALNARQNPPSADADLHFSRLSLKPFFADTEFVQEMGGRFSGHIYLLGVGQNLDQMMASARGRGWIGMREGTLSGLLIEAVGLDVVEALVLVVADDGRVPVRCARVDVTVGQGIVALKRATVDTTDSTLVAEGSADLNAERINIMIQALAKDFRSHTHKRDSQEGRIVIQAS